MECFYCQGTLVRHTVNYSANRKGYHLIIDDVPAWVCTQCGEPLFDEATIDAIQKALHEVDLRMSNLLSHLPKSLSLVCDVCGKEGAKIRHISRSYEEGKSLLVIESVPVISCPHCGESYLTAETLHEIARIKLPRQSFAKPRPVPVAVFAQKDRLNE